MERLKEFSCRDVGMDCDYKVQGRTEEELFLNAEKHSREDHGSKEPLSDDLKNAIRAKIHEVEVERVAS
jgi:predicted small metal-binding protein